MSEPANAFIYKRKFKKTTFGEKIELFSDTLKRLVLKSLFSSRLKSKLSLTDRLSADGERPRSSQLNIPERVKYDKIKLNNIRFFEALEIDDFDSYKAVLLNRFAKEDPYSPFSFSRNKDSIKESLSEVKDSLSTITQGGTLCFIEFRNKKKADLLENVRLSYVKTQESYFILTIDVKPSKRFVEFFDAIVASDDVSIETIKYNRLFDIFRTGKIVSHSLVQRSSIYQGLNDLLADLSYQVRLHVTNYLKGLFNSEEFLPRIEHFEVGNINDFEKDALMSRYVLRSLDRPFKLEHGKVQVVPGSYQIRILTERGHNGELFPGAVPDGDWVGLYYLLMSLSLPCSLNAVLDAQQKQLMGLKRRVYDYVNLYSRRKNFTFSFWRQSSYVKLKVSFAKSMLTFTRFDKEFSERNLAIFSHDFDLSELKLRKGAEDDSKDLKSYFEKSIRVKVDRLNNEAKTLYEIFRPIEDLNVYHTNVRLQWVSILVAVLAIVLSADKILEWAKKFFDWLAGVFSST